MTSTIPEILDLPDSWEDDLERWAAAEGLTPGEYLAHLRKRAAQTTATSEIPEVSALRRELRHFGELLKERVQRPGGEWLDAREAAQRLRMSVRALYVEIGTHPSGPLAQAASRLGRRLRFSRAGIDALLSRRAVPLRKRARFDQLRARVPSPGKESERW